MSTMFSLDGYPGVSLHLDDDSPWEYAPEHSGVVLKKKDAPQFVMIQMQNFVRPHYGNTPEEIWLECYRENPRYMWKKYYRLNFDSNWAFYCKAQFRLYRMLHKRNWVKVKMTEPVQKTFWTTQEYLDHYDQCAREHRIRG